MLFYFTGTGNSLYVAKKIEKNPVSIPQAMQQENPVFKDDEIGIVCPVYGHVPPQMVQSFLKKATFKTDYFFILLTYGNIHGGAAELTNQIAADCGIKADYINTILMVDNFLPGFDMEEQKGIDKKVDEQLVQIIEDITLQKHMIQAATEEDRQMHEVFVKRSAQMPADAFKNLYQISDQCNGCGICVKVCPGACFHVESGKAVQNSHNCQTCMACIHHCPQMAVKLVMPEKNPNARYRNEHITLQEIITANNQLHEV